MKFNKQFILALAALAVFTHSAIGARGDLDLSFSPGVNGRVYESVMQVDGKILIAGFFTEVGGMARSKLARLHADGTLDQGFNPNVGASDEGIYSIAVQADGKIVIGGFFTSAVGMTRSNIARLHTDGALDLGFGPNVAGSVERCVLQADGKILIAGRFPNVNGVARNSIARLNANGTLDADFYPLAESSHLDNVYDLALQPDGKILVIRVGGSVVTFHDDFVRLNADGTLDMDFHVDTNDEVEALALQTDGKILIGGDFSTVSGVPRSRLARLNSDGTLDPGFTPGAYGTPYEIAVQADGKILIVGDLVGSRIKQLDGNGVLDPTFSANTIGYVYGVSLQPDGKILISGPFTSINGISRTNFARLLGAERVSLYARPSGNEMVLSWPTNVTGFSLQATTNLSPPLLWVEVTNAPVLNGAHFTITNAFSGGAQYYRLRKP